MTTVLGSGRCAQEQENSSKPSIAALHLLLSEREPSPAWTRPELAEG